jgi:hypothetical protein
MLHEASSVQYPVLWARAGWTTDYKDILQSFYRLPKLTGLLGLASLLCGMLGPADRGIQIFTQG